MRWQVGREHSSQLVAFHTFVQLFRFTPKSLESQEGEAKKLNKCILSPLFLLFRLSLHLLSWLITSSQGDILCHTGSLSDDRHTINLTRLRGHPSIRRELWRHGCNRVTLRFSTAAVFADRGANQHVNNAVLFPFTHQLQGSNNTLIWLMSGCNQFCLFVSNSPTLSHCSIQSAK